MASPHSAHKRKRDSSATRRALRLKDTRVVRAAKRTADEQARLDALIVLQEAEAASATAARAVDEWTAPFSPRVKSAAEAAETFEREQRRAELRERWTLSFARNLLRSGYSLDHCVGFTGWDARWFDGVTPGEW